MKIAVAVIGNEASQHFGHSEKFYIYEVEGTKILNKDVKESPGHGHSLIGDFMKSNGVDIVIAGCMGTGAFYGLKEYGLQVLTGANGTPDEIVESYLNGTLELKEDGCIHQSAHHGHNHGHHHSH